MTIHKQHKCTQYVMDDSGGYDTIVEYLDKLIKYWRYRETKTKYNSDSTYIKGKLKALRAVRKAVVNGFDGKVYRAF